MPTKLDPQDKQIKDLITKEGLNARQVADKIGMPYHQVLYRCHKMEIDLDRGRPASDDPTRKIVLSMPQSIEDALAAKDDRDVSVQTKIIAAIARDLGIELESEVEA